MNDAIAIKAATIFDGDSWHEESALVLRDGVVEGIVAASGLPAGDEVISVDGMLVPGFVDLQVNGGGGIMLNDRQDVEAIRTICAAHAPFGTTALLPTLITDTPEITRSAVEAGAEAGRRKVPGFLGLHLEGPHLSIARKGAHDPALIRPMDDGAEASLIAAHEKVPVLLTTVAPESVEPARIERLVKAGIVVSLGHSDTSYPQAIACAEAGASMATHLFNAMSQITNREPGLAGAAIDSGRFFAGIIADGFHVDPATIRIAVKAKSSPGRLFLVTDAMATIGTDMTSFTLNGRTITRADGRLTLEDGTLAGADLDMISAVRFMHRTIGVELSEALRMASLYPARAMGLDGSHGRLAKGARADLVHLSKGLDVLGVWIRGEQVFFV
ncbi:N-acetylglucosamine-6-phosphate deacetylase [Mesorhizobium sp. 1B3]|uniref:N-acetylglucosamine-6-phosphate deacetylase n=1 Tax=Mesorhizobium sp. 1B3 TaxID=3243599 RepID=UPI003D95DA01